MGEIRIIIPDSIHKQIKLNARLSKKRMSEVIIDSLKYYAGIYDKDSLIRHWKERAHFKVSAYTENAVTRAYHQDYITAPVEMLTDKELLKVRNIGAKCLKQIREIMPYTGEGSEDSSLQDLPQRPNAKGN